MKKDTSFAKTAALALLPAALAVAPVAMSMRLRVVRYTLPTQKLTRPVRLALLSDLHDCYYGPRQRDIVGALRRQRPDAVLMAGDMADDKRRHHNTTVLVRQLAEACPTYYVSGNHEVWSGTLHRIKNLLRGLGVTVLEGDCTELYVRGQALRICGVDDPCRSYKGHLAQMRRTAQAVSPEVFSVLLAHRPEYAPWYAQGGYDLILAGHAHGGQWRVPGLCNGVYVADQGFFPKYAGGEYHIENSAVIISRGLARESTPVPRIFNRPEVVLVDLLPKSP